MSDQRRLPPHLQKRIEKQQQQQMQQQQPVEAQQNQEYSQANTQVNNQQQLNQVQQNQNQTQINQLQQPKNFQTNNQINQPVQSQYQNQQQQQQFQLQQQETLQQQQQQQKQQQQIQAQQQLQQSYQQGQQPQQPQQQQTKKQQKLDSEQIPRPLIQSENSIKLIEVNTASVCNAPYAYSNFVQDNLLSAGPRFIRTSLNSVSSEQKQMKQVNLPLGVIIQPFADVNENEEPIQTVLNIEGDILLRCQRCKAYVNGYWQFNHNNTAQCNICKMSNPLSSHYILDISQIINNCTDKYPELKNGVYELQTPKQYVNKPIENYRNNIVFCIEMSPLTVGLGIFSTVLQTIQKLVDCDMINNYQITDIAIITFNTQIAMYNIPQDLNKELHILQVGDIDDVCVALSKQEMFLNAKDQKDQILYLIEKLNKLSEPINDQYIEILTNNQNNRLIQNSCMGSALLNSVHSVFPNNGRVIMFTTQNPSNGFGKFKPREVNKIVNTDKEKTLFLSSNDQFTSLTKFCLDNKVAVDLFYFPATLYQDVQQLIQVVNKSGGQVYYYQKYNQNQQQKLENELQRNLTRSTVYDVIMTIRGSHGLVLQEYYDSDGQQLVRDLESSMWHADKVINIIMKQEENIAEDKVYLQFAILCTDSCGMRKVRVINQQLNVVNDILQIYRSIDVDALSRTLSLSHINNIDKKQFKEIRQEMVSQLATVFYNYRVQCVPNTNPAQLIFPDSLKLLPLYLQSLGKHQILHLSNNLISPDTRVIERHLFNSIDLYSQSLKLSPKIYPLDALFSDGDDDQVGDYVDDMVLMPTNLPLMLDKILQDHIYLIDNSDTIFLLINPQSHNSQILDLFGVQTYVDLQQVADQGLPYIEENTSNVKLNNMINQLFKNKNSSCQNVYILLNNDPHYQFFMNMIFLEEQTKGGDSYVDFLCQLHKQIQEKYV